LAASLATVIEHDEEESASKRPRAAPTACVCDLCSAVPSHTTLWGRYEPVEGPRGPEDCPMDSKCLSCLQLHK
jgi:hypothetical protein